MSTNDIQLTFINESNDMNNSQVVIFQQNVADSIGELAVAWKVIENCSQGDTYPFLYPLALSVSACDSYGNYTPQLEASDGQQFTVQQDASGNSLVYTGAAADGQSIELLNGLKQGAIDASVYRGGKLLAVKTGVAPAQKAMFSFRPNIWIGVVSQVEEGQVLDSAIISAINTELSLVGIKSADIVMTGGGPGPGSQPFTFTLDNIIYY